MQRAVPLNELIHRFLEDQGDLSPDELDALIAGLREQPARAAAVREQLIVDCLLAQKLSLDRRNFLAQVEQRIADYEQREEEIDSQVVELRELAAAEIERPAARHRQNLWVQGVLGVSLLAVLAGVFLLPRILPRRPHAIARVRQVEGAVIATQDQQSSALAPAATLFSGQQIATPAAASLEIEYEDRSLVKIAGDSLVTVDAEPTSGAKRLRIDRGQLWASVVPQTDGPLQIVTPHAVATVVGTQFRLTVGSDDTLLEVSQGQVRLDRLDQTQSIMVSDNESGLASAEVLDHRTVQWPENDEGLAFAYDPFTRTQARFRNPEKAESMTLAEYQIVGSAAQNDFSGVLELSGGYLREDDGGNDLVALCRPGSGFTLEIVFTPASSQTNSPARIVSLEGAAGDANFVLSQEGNTLHFTLGTDGKPRPLVIPLPATRPVHLTISCLPEEQIAYQAGKAVVQSKETPGELASWAPGPLLIGADSRGEASWHGTIEAMAIYHRAVDAAEAARNVHHYRVLAGRP